jgi:hypothetical protein
MAKLWQSYGKMGQMQAGRWFYIVFDWQIRQGTGFDRNAFFKEERSLS